MHLSQTQDRDGVVSPYVYRFRKYVQFETNAFVVAFLLLEFKARGVVS